MKIELKCVCGATAAFDGGVAVGDLIKAFHHMNAVAHGANPEVEITNTTP